MLGYGQWQASTTARSKKQGENAANQYKQNGARLEKLNPIQKGKTPPMREIYHNIQSHKRHEAIKAERREHLSFIGCLISFAAIYVMTAL